MAKNLPGYPSAKNIQKQAAQLAQGAVPTRRSIRQQYALPIQANQGFTEALIHLLQGGGGAVSSGYDQAIQQQQGIDQAAANRLAALGGPYGAGSAAAVSGLGSSALSSLNAQSAAAKNYAGQLPSVAASRGQLMNAQLLQQRNQALQQRQSDYRSALQQALQNVQQNALAISTLRSQNKNAALDRALQQQQMDQQNAQFQSSQAEQRREFNLEHSPAWLTLQAQIQAAASGSGGGGVLSKYTPTEINSMLHRSNEALTGSGNLAYTTTIGRAINAMVHDGIARPIAIAQATNAYRNLQPPTKADFTKRTYNQTTGKFENIYDKASFNQNMALYRQIMSNFRRWSARQWFKKNEGTKKKRNQFVTTPPGYQH